MKISEIEALKFLSINSYFGDRIPKSEIVILKFKYFEKFHVFFNIAGAEEVFFTRDADNPKTAIIKPKSNQTNNAKLEDKNESRALKARVSGNYLVVSL